MAVEVALHLLEPLVRDLHARAVALEEAAAEPAPDVEARRVAQDRADPDQPDQGEQLDLALAGDRAAGDHDRLARCDRPTNAPVSRNASTPTSAYVQGPSASAMSPISFFGSGSSDSTPLA